MTRVFMRRLVAGFVKVAIIAGLGIGISQFGGLREIPEAARLFVFSLFAMLISLFRSHFLHPLSSRAYVEFLRTTPWVPGTPLPTGPILFGMFDGVVLVGIGVLWWFDGLHSALFVMMAWVGAYALGLLLTLVRGRRWLDLWILGMMTGAALLISTTNQISLMSVTVLYALLIAASYRSLSVIPFDRELVPSRSAIDRELEFKRSTDGAVDPGLGWPHDALSPRKPPGPIPSGVALAIAVLTGFLVFAIGWRLAGVVPGGREDEPDPVILFLGVITLIFSMFRVVRYLSGARCPLSIRGRIATGRLVIPGFDVALIAPALVVAVGFVALWVRLRSGIPDSLVMGATVGLDSAIVLGIGPAVHRWRLAGTCELRPVVPQARRPRTA